MTLALINCYIRILFVFFKRQTVRLAIQLTQPSAAKLATTEALKIAIFNLFLNHTIQKLFNKVKVSRVFL